MTDLKPDVIQQNLSAPFPRGIETPSESLKLSASMRLLLKNSKNIAKHFNTRRQTEWCGCEAQEENSVQD